MLFDKSLKNFYYFDNKYLYSLLSSKKNVAKNNHFKLKLQKIDTFPSKNFNS